MTHGRSPSTRFPGRAHLRRAFFAWVLIAAIAHPPHAAAQTYPIGVPEGADVPRLESDASTVVDDMPGATVIEPLPTATPLEGQTDAPAPAPAPAPPKRVAVPLPPLPPQAELEAGVPCVITAYYSALPNQERYATGSYERELILEGNGTNGADGTPVYVGMVAASKQYPFGTKVYIPGFGLGEVHDRGGAIVGTCRLDIWMGWGDLGLSRALAWGKRTVTCRIFLPGRGIPPELQQEASLLQAPPATRAPRGEPVAKPFYTSDLTIGDTGQKVRDLEGDLQKLGYFRGTPDDAYDLATAQAVFAFQEAQDIVQSQDSYGAGYFGYQTRRALSRWRSGAEALESAKAPASTTPQLTNLRRVIAKGERSPEVRQAQELLSALGYFEGEPTGIFGDQTRSAVLRFQQEHRIVASESDKGAGTIGPVTVKKLLDVADAAAAWTRTYTRGDRSDVVREVQGHLVALGRLDADARTGYFGDVTLAAVRAFQLDTQLVASAADPNCGRLGPVTTAAITRARREQDLRATALKRGDRGDSVKEVQQLLVRSGYQLPAVSGFFGTATEDAVRAFQKRMRLIRTDEDLGAGMVGPVTRTALLAAANERAAVAAADQAGATVAPSEPAQ